MTTYDNWKTTTPEDEEDARNLAEAKANARIESMIDDMEYTDFDDGPWA